MNQKTSKLIGKFVKLSDIKNKKKYKRYIKKIYNGLNWIQRTFFILDIKAKNNRK